MRKRFDSFLEAEEEDRITDRAVVRGKNAGTGIGGREREDKRNKFIARSSEN